MGSSDRDVFNYLRENHHSAKLFVVHGIPEQLVSDNGPMQFTSVEFDVFLKANGVRYICSAPYHLQSNREAERFVQMFKNALKIRKEDEGDVQTKLF